MPEFPAMVVLINVAGPELEIVRLRGPPLKFRKTALPLSSIVPPLPIAVPTPGPYLVPPMVLFDTSLSTIVIVPLLPMAEVPFSKELLWRTWLRRRSSVPELLIPPVPRKAWFPDTLLSINVSVPKLLMPPIPHGM